MPLRPDPAAGFLNDLAAIEQSIARSTIESATNESLDGAQFRARPAGRVRHRPAAWAALSLSTAKSGAGRVHD
jgi:hypothetical protein